jgi:hypothetical protein
MNDAAKQKLLEEIAEGIVSGLTRYIDAQVDERVGEILAALPSVSPEHEKYELTPNQLAHEVGCGRDTIIAYVHEGVLKDCFILAGTHYKFRKNASIRAIEAYSASQAMPEKLMVEKPISTSGKRSNSNLRAVPGRRAGSAV